MTLDDNIDEITSGLGEVIESMKLDAKAEKLAHQALEQFQSLTYDAWIAEGRPANANLDQLAKVTSQDMDIVLYGKAIHHAIGHMQDNTKSARRRWPVLIRSWRPKIRRNIRQADEAFELGVTYLALRKIKLEIIRQYEEEKAKK